MTATRRRPVGDWRNISVCIAVFWTTVQRWFSSPWRYVWVWRDIRTWWCGCACNHFRHTRFTHEVIYTKHTLPFVKNAVLLTDTTLLTPLRFQDITDGTITKQTLMIQICQESSIHLSSVHLFDLWNHKSCDWQTADTRGTTALCSRGGV